MAKIEHVNIEDAVGMTLSHDMTQIDVKSGYKGARFKKGHVVKSEDLPVLRSMGKSAIAVMELEEGELHEDDATLRLASRLAGEGLRMSSPEEGKVSLFAEWNGLVVYDENSIHSINSDLDWIVATLPNKVPARKDETVAGIRVVPLTMSADKVHKAESAALPITIFPFHPLKTALVTTGQEIVEGRIRDAFAPKLIRKLASYGSTLMEQAVTGDGKEEISSAIRSFLEKGAELIIVTGGMSVDADDRTGAAIADVSDSVVFNGIPVLPGARLMLGLHEKTKIVGAPACVVHDEWTSLDILLNRLFAGLIPTLPEVRRWGTGGFCRKCRNCNYPICAFASR
jgi:hypothetical protein